MTLNLGFQDLTILCLFASSGFLIQMFIMEIVYKISTYVFEGLRTDICEIPSTRS